MMPILLTITAHSTLFEGMSYMPLVATLRVCMSVMVFANGDACLFTNLSFTGEFVNYTRAACTHLIVTINTMSATGLGRSVGIYLIEAISTK